MARNELVLNKEGQIAIAADAVFSFYGADLSDYLIHEGLLTTEAEIPTKALILKFLKRARLHSFSIIGENDEVEQTYDLISFFKNERNLTHFLFEALRTHYRVIFGDDPESLDQSITLISEVQEGKIPDEEYTLFKTVYKPLARMYFNSATQFLRKMGVIDDKSETLSEYIEEWFKHAQSVVEGSDQIQGLLNSLPSQAVHGLLADPTSLVGLDIVDTPEFIELNDLVDTYPQVFAGLLLQLMNKQSRQELLSKMDAICKGREIDDYEEDEPDYLTSG